MKQSLLIFPFLTFLLFSCKPSTEELYMKAEKLIDTKQYANAIIVYDKILKRNSNMQDAYYNKGYCYMKDSNYTEALRLFDIVLEMKGVKNGTGFIFQMNSDSPFASEEDRHQITVDAVYYQIGVTKYMMDSLLPAYRLFQHCADRYYEKATCRYWQGLIWLSADSVSKACRFFDESRKLGEPAADEALKEYCQNTSVK